MEKIIEMPNGRKQIKFENARFIFRTNFQGNPDRDKYRSNERYGNVVIEDEDLARALKAEGFNVRTYDRKDSDEIVSTVYYIRIKLNFNPPVGVRPPKVYYVDTEEKPTLLDEDTIGHIDDLQDSRNIKSVNATCNLRYSRDTSNTVWVNVMYVEESFEEDPWAGRYQTPSVDISEDDPF